MRTIRLYGELGKKYGRVHKFDVGSVGEAVRALCANFKTFREHLINSSERIAGYEVWHGNKNIDATHEDVHGRGDGDIKIIPRISGASAAAKIIVGVVLIIIGFVLSFTPFAGASPYFYKAGAVMIMSGTIDYFMKPSSGVAVFNESSDSQSYVFSGPTNATRQGNPVFVGYGEMIVGSQVIGATLTTADI